MNERTENENYITVTVYGDALPKFGENDALRTLTLLKLLVDGEVDVRDLNGITDDEGTFTASFVSETPMAPLTQKALEALETHTISLNEAYNADKAWRVDIFHENEADISYDLEDAQYFQSEDDWNWGLTSLPS